MKTHHMYWLRFPLLGAIGLAAVAPAWAQWQPVLKNTPAIASDKQETPSLPVAATPKDGFKFAAAGDLLGPYAPRLIGSDARLAPVAKLFRESDAGFANLEANLFDTWEFNGYPAAENGGFEQGGVGGGPLLPKAIAGELKKMGITMVSTANNHSLDWGVEGLLETIRNLDESGVVHAGSGRSLLHARAPAYQAAAGGTVALIASATTFMPMAPAGAGGGTGRELKAARPGIAAIRSRPIALVTAPELETLKRIAQRQGRPVDASDKEVTLTPNEAVLIQQTFRASERTGLTYELQQDDRAGILRAIRAGKERADVAVFSIHAHETESGGQEFEAAADTLAPADFLRPLFHDAVDAGADIVLTHGPHVLRGIEIYKGRPIFYGLGSFFFELGADWPREWFDSVVAVSEFRGGRIAEVRLYPIVLGTPAEARPRLEQGTPHLAAGSDARRILETLQRQSERFGTHIQIEGAIGVIRPTQPR